MRFLIITVLTVFTITSSFAKLKVGDRHPDGGIIVSIDAGNKKGLVCMEKDLGKFTYADAITACKNLGDGWAFPSITQLESIYQNLYLKGIGGFEKAKYRSATSSGYPHYPWAMNFATGKREGDGLNNKTNVRPVRVISIEDSMSAEFGDGWYRFTTKFQGDGKSLDVINDSQDNKLILAKTGNFTGQKWKITKLSDGYYRLTTKFQGEGKSLDVVNDSQDNKLILAKTGNYTGQKWKITKLSDGYYRLTTKFQGEGKSLDVVNDAQDNKLTLAKTGNFTGQKWKITKVN